MIIECPNCRTKFKIQDSLITKEEQKLKCSKCENIFEVGENIFNIKQNLDDFSEDMAEKQIIESIQNSTPNTQKETKKPTNETSNFNRQMTTKKAHSNKSMILLLLLCTILLLLGIYFAIFYKIIDINSLFSSKTQPQKVEIAKVENPKKQILFQDGKAYSVINEKNGEIFVVEGNIVNLSAKKKKDIQLIVKVIKDNKTINSQIIYPGKILTKDQLEQLSIRNIAQALTLSAHGDKGIILHPQEKMRFMAVFAAPQLNNASFDVEIKSFIDVD